MEALIVSHFEKKQFNVSSLVTYALSISSISNPRHLNLESYLLELMLLQKRNPTRQTVNKTEANLPSLQQSFPAKQP